MKSRQQLTDSQLVELTVRAKQTKNVKEARRIQALVLFSDGESFSRIKRLTFLGRSHVFSLLRSYGRSGLSALVSKPRRINELLTQAQLKEIESLLKTKQPNQLGYEAGGWTTHVLSHYIEQTYDVKYKSKTSYYLIFKRLKFTYHKPGRVYEKRDEAEVAAWRKQTKLIIGQALTDKGTIVLAADEMILSTQTTFQKIWLPEGKYPKITVSNTKKNAVVHGYLNLKTGQEHAFTTKRLTMYEVKKILKKIRQIYPKQEIILFWDQPGWHKGSQVAQFIERDKKIKVIYFPKYSPEENPQEHVWKAGRAQVTHNTFIRSLGKTTRKFLAYLNTTKFPYSLLGFKSSGGV